MKIKGKIFTHFFATFFVLKIFGLTLFGLKVFGTTKGQLTSQTRVKILHQQKNFNFNNFLNFNNLLSMYAQNTSNATVSGQSKFFSYF